MFYYLFFERGRHRGREGEKHQCVVVSLVPPTGDLACNPSMYPDWELNEQQQPFGSQAHAQSTELHQSKQQNFSLHSNLFYTSLFCTLEVFKYTVDPIFSINWKTKLLIISYNLRNIACLSLHSFYLTKSRVLGFTFC